VRTQVITTFLAMASLKPLFRQATTKLAARRLTSHSHGAEGFRPGHDGEEDPPLRGAKSPEVAQVGVPATLDADPGGRGGSEVAGHGKGRTPVESEGERAMRP